MNSCKHSDKQAMHDADPAEAERLRADLKHLMNTSVKGEVFDIVCKERDTLRAQLAEQDALLRKALADVEYIQKECGGDVSPGYIGCLVDDVVNLLSANAEPIEEDNKAFYEVRGGESGRPCYGPNEWGTECGKCVKCNADNSEPSAPVEIDDRASAEVERLKALVQLGLKVIENDGSRCESDASEMRRFLDEASKL